MCESHTVTIITRSLKITRHEIRVILSKWIRYFLFPWFLNISVMPYYGPARVAHSLCFGLKKLGKKYHINPRKADMSHITCVLSDVAALKWAIREKKKGNIEYIFAGPNIVTMPSDYNNILCAPEINCCIVNSEWVMQLYVNSAPCLKNRIRIWAAGVDQVKDLQLARTHFLVYKKNVPEDIFQFVIDTLREINIPFKVIIYGEYIQKEYRDLLQGTCGMIYLTAHESQGMALQEAWMCDVPTLVWSRGIFKLKDISAPASSAPYLTNDCGLFFTSKHDFVDSFMLFRARLTDFNPRDYAEKNLNHANAAQRYLDIINEFV